MTFLSYNSLNEMNVDQGVCSLKKIQKTWNSQGFLFGKIRKFLWNYNFLYSNFMEFYFVLEFFSYLGNFFKIYYL